MKKIIAIFIYLTFSNSLLFANELLFKPLEANVWEARVGAIYEFEDDKLRLDIGNSVDLIKFKDVGIFDKLNIGADFFIMSRLRSEGRMKFPVETADYFFGVNTSSEIKFENFDLMFRLRLAHISSHLIDGYTYNWEFIQEPFVYSREFVELVSALQSEYFRVYFGLTGIFSTLPKDVNTFIPQIGFDCKYPISEKLYFISGYDFKLDGYSSVSSGVNSIKVGFRILTFEDIGLDINYNYYSGLSLHGMFFKEKDNYNSIGFSIIFY